MALTENRRRILARLESRDLKRECAESAEEIRIALGRKTKGWANVPLSNMALQGLVRRLGVAMSGAATWTITDKGREALALPVPATSQMEK